MQYIIEWIRKIVLLVLLMEVVLQLQAGKQYEDYIKMLIGIMVIYSLVSGIFVFAGRLEQVELQPMREFQWSGNLFSELEEQAKNQIDVSLKKNDFNGKIKEHNLDAYMEVQVEVSPVSEINIPVFYVESSGE